MSANIAIAVTLLVIGVIYNVNGEYNVNTYCSLVKNGVKLPSIESCQKFYVCNNGIGTEDQCTSTQSFDKETQSCKLSSEVDCYYGVENPCEGKDKTYAPVVGTCDGWIYCVNGAELGRGKCADGLIFQNNECVYGDCTINGDGGDQNQLSSVCQLMQLNVYFGSTLDCKMWQLCQTTGYKSGNCPGDYVFDVQSRICDYESGDMCSRVTGEEIQPEESACSDPDGTVTPDAKNCTISNQCMGGKLIPNYCPNGQYYDEIDSVCKSRQLATPIETCDRCFGSTKQFVNYVDSDCQKYWICKDGVQDGRSVCGEGSYFDEVAQACVFGDETTKNEYIASTGACPASDGNTPSDDNCEFTNDPTPTCTCKDGATPCNCVLNTSNDGCEPCPNGVTPEGTCYTQPCNDVDGTCKCTGDASTCLTQCGSDATGTCSECSDACTTANPTIEPPCSDVAGDCTCEPDDAGSPTTCQVAAT